MKTFQAVTEEGKELIKKSLSKQDWELIKKEIDYNFTQKEFNESKEYNGSRYLYFVLGLEVSEAVTGEWFPILEYENEKFGKVKMQQLNSMVKTLKKWRKK